MAVLSSCSEGAEPRRRIMMEAPAAELAEPRRVADDHGDERET
jgi:hypothetical protein